MAQRNMGKVLQDFDRAEAKGQHKFVFYPGEMREVASWSFPEVFNDNEGTKYLRGDMVEGQILEAVANALKCGYELGRKAEKQSAADKKKLEERYTYRKGTAADSRGQDPVRSKERTKT